MNRRALWIGVLLFVGWLSPPPAHAGLSCYRYEYAPNLVRAAQKVLRKEGLYKGVIDGKWGPRTRDAVVRFQWRHEISFRSRTLAEDNLGQLEEQTLKAMFGEEAVEGLTVVRNPHHAPEEYWERECH